jgi:hypothetical protein
MTNFFINQVLLNGKQSTNGNGPATMDKETLEIHIGTCLMMIPPRQLSQCLRESFMLNWENLQNTTPDFKQLVTEMMVLLARLDDLADQQLKHCSCR